MARPIEHDHDKIVHVPAKGFGDRLEIVRRGRIEADVVLRRRTDDELLHIQIGRVQQAALLGGGEHRDGVRRPGGAEVGAFQRIDGDVDFRETHQSEALDALGVDEAHLLADVEHRRLIALPFADDDRAVDRHGVQDRPHRFDGDLVRFVTIAVAHRMRARDGRLFDDAEKFEGEIGIH